MRRLLFRTTTASGLMRAAAFIALLLVISGPSLAADVHFVALDPATRQVIRTLLAPELADDPQGMEGARMAWIKAAPREPPYLFVMLNDVYYCGSGGCQIWGFRKTAHGWERVYHQFGGEGIELLDTETDGHHDLGQYEQEGAGDSVEHISHWTGSQYGETMTFSVPQ